MNKNAKNNYIILKLRCYQTKSGYTTRLIYCFSNTSHFFIYRRQINSSIRKYFKVILGLIKIEPDISFHVIDKFRTVKQHKHTSEGELTKHMGS